MKYVFLLVTVAVVYLFLVRQAPVAPVVAEITQKEAVSLSRGPKAGPDMTPTPTGAGTNALKRPIDRTREVMGQVKQRNGQGEF